MGSIAFLKKKTGILYALCQTIFSHAENLVQNTIYFFGKIHSIGVAGKNKIIQARWKGYALATFSAIATKFKGNMVNSMVLLYSL